MKKQNYKIVPEKLGFNGAVPVVLQNKMELVLGTATLNEKTGVDIRFYREGNGTFNKLQMEEIILACKTGSLKPHLKLRCTPEEAARIQSTKQLDRAEVIAVSLDFPGGN